MSVDLIVYLPRHSMPTPAQWAKAIVDAGFPVELGSDFDPFTATGFRPCRFRGVVSGFEIYSGPVSEDEATALSLPTAYDFLVNLVTHADLREFATALIAACVLCHLACGMFYDPQEDHQRHATGILSWAHEQVALIEKEIE
jgi:hypothetical protein